MCDEKEDFINPDYHEAVVSRLVSVCRDLRRWVYNTRCQCSPVADDPGCPRCQALAETAWIEKPLPDSVVTPIQVRKHLETTKGGK